MFALSILPRMGQRCVPTQNSDTIAFIVRLHYSLQTSSIVANNWRNEKDVRRIEPMGRRETVILQFRTRLRYREDTVCETTAAGAVGLPSSNGMSSYCLFLESCH